MEERSYHYGQIVYDALKNSDFAYLDKYMPVSGIYGISRKLGLCVLHNQDSLARYRETYKKALEEQKALMKVIDLSGILKNVQSIWGGGRISETERGGMVLYDYKIPAKVMVQEIRARGWSGRAGPDYNCPTLYYEDVWTGRWGIRKLQVAMEIGSSFGNSKFNSPYTETLDPFFADVYNGRYYVFDHLPKTIWRSPDNLSVYVAVPDVNEKKWFGETMFHLWFDPPCFSKGKQPTKQEIMDYLEQQFDAQRKVGRLPSQLESQGLAEIEKLRLRSG